MSAVDTEWLWLEVADRQWLEALPSSTDGIFTANRPTTPANPDDFADSQRAHHASQLCFNCRIVSANILTAAEGSTNKRTKRGSRLTHSDYDVVDDVVADYDNLGPLPLQHGRHIVGRSKVLAEQLDAAKVLIVAMQETRAEEGEYFIYPYVIFSGGRTETGLEGSEIWVHTSLVYGSINGIERCINWNHLNVCHSEPSIVLCTFIAPMFHVLIGSAHAPPKTPQHPLPERAHWWDRLLNAIHRHRKTHLVMIGIDANAEMGSIISEWISDHGAEQQCSNGDFLHTWIAGLHLFVPATFANLHTGATTTHMHPEWQVWTRKDYLLVCDTLFPTVQSSFVSDDIDISLGRVDHLPVALSLTGTLQRQEGKEWRIKHTFGKRDYNDTVKVQNFQHAICKQLPPIWDVNVTMHCAGQTAAIKNLVKTYFPIIDDGPRKSIITQET